MTQKFSARPSILVLGGADATDEISYLLGRRDIGVLLDNGHVKDIPFGLHELASKADAILVYADANPVQIFTLLAEVEVGNHCFCHIKDGKIGAKPVVLAGTPGSWNPFHEMFESMKSSGVMRRKFEEGKTCISDIKKALTFFQEKLPPSLPLCRTDYYHHIISPPDPEYTWTSEPTIIHEHTISFFGSATTKISHHIESGRKLVTLTSDHSNILHGAGTEAVMGEFTKVGHEKEVLTIGVTVMPQGAPLIAGNERNMAGGYKEVHLLIKSSDMLLRIESYMGHSNGAGLCHGGVGSIQEISLVAQLRAMMHPVMMDITAGGERVQKPIAMLNDNGHYDPFLTFLRDSSAPHLINEFQVCRSVGEVNEFLKSEIQGRKIVPYGIKYGDDTLRKFRARYADYPVARGETDFRLPDLSTLRVEGIASLERPRERGVEVRA